jgi:NAD(P)-dependent dehydrogenase (short-subunit alcohol dehydrogenase family)
LSGPLRLDGRVAVVTGAGGNPGLGRAYALLLAERGARVVVNDLGIGPGGRPALAEEVADEIVGLGGHAVADKHSVAEADGARQVVQTAIDAWGRLDVVVNNAGVCCLAPFHLLSETDVQRMVEVHLYGTLWMCRAAWLHLQASGSGRIVNIGSESMLGHAVAAVYGAAKSGIFSLSRSLALEGAPSGIGVNTVMPAAFTAALDWAIEESDAKRDAEAWEPELVAPLVAYLAHPDCLLSGTCLAFREGRIWELYITETVGHRLVEFTPEAVRDTIEEIRAREDARENTPNLSAERRTFVPRPYVPQAPG